MIIKKKGGKERQNIGLCDEPRWGIVMKVTSLTPPVLLPGAGSEISFQNPSV